MVSSSVIIIRGVCHHLRLGRRGLAKQTLVHRTAVRVFGPVLSSALMAITMFTPLVFMKNVINRLFVPFTLAVAFTLNTSLLMTVAVIPTLSRFLFEGGLCDRGARNDRGRTKGLSG